MEKKDYKKGTVKKVDREKLLISILGPINKKTGVYQEKQVQLHCVNILTEFKAEAFDILRQELVGQQIEFSDYDCGDNVAADIIHNGTNVAYMLASQGLVEVFSFGEKTSPFYERYKEAEELAMNKQLGKFKELTKDDKK